MASPSKRTPFIDLSSPQSKKNTPTKTHVAMKADAAGKTLKKEVKTKKLAQSKKHIMKGSPKKQRKLPKEMVDAVLTHKRKGRKPVPRQPRKLVQTTFPSCFKK